MSLNHLPDELRETVKGMLDETRREMKENANSVETNFLSRLNEDDFSTALKYYSQNPQSRQLNDLLAEKLSKIVTELNHNINNKGLFSFLF